MTRLSGASSPVEGPIERRLAVTALMVTCVWLVLIARLFYLQVMQTDQFRLSAERNSVRTHRVKATRGIVLDRNGTILVDSRPSFDVLVVPQETDNLELTLQRVALLTGQDGEELRERIGTPRGRARFQALALKRDLGRQLQARVETRLLFLPGVLTEVTPVRAYRFGDSAAHSLGRLGEISSAQLGSREFQGYRRGDVLGTEGIERLLDREIRGKDGGKNVLVDAYGRELKLLGSIEPQPGQNVVLTLDQRLQRAAEAALDSVGPKQEAKAGAVVAVDPRNGEILVLVSRPAFNPNHFAAGIEQNEWNALQKDPRTPLHNRALQGQYPPGSTYKLVTALAGLEEGLIKPDDTVQCAGSFRLGRRRYRCWKRGGHGLVNLQRALVESCDVYFYRLGVELGVDMLAKYARALGFGSKTGIELGPEAAGLVPDKAWKERRFNEPWIEGETVSLAIGQGFNLWTPIQLAMAYASVANGGKRHRPFLVKRIEDAYGEVLRETEPEVVAESSFSAVNLELVRRGLRGVVHDPHGTGWVMRRLPGGVESAGKTGTAQVVALTPELLALDEEEIPERYRDHAWFVTYLPADEPRITIAVLVEHGGHGGSAAAPIALRVAEEFLKGEGELLARN